MENLQNGTRSCLKNTKTKKKNTGHSHRNRKMLHLRWRRSPAIPNLGKENCKERLDGIRYRKEGGLSEFRKRTITIFDGIFDRGRRGTYETIPRVPAKPVTSL